MRLPKRIILQIPILTILILGLSIVSYILPEVSSVLIYDRPTILKGEVWRLFSSPLVHFTRIHLFYNLLGFAIAGWIIEYKKYQYFGLLCLLMAFFISLSLMIMMPNIIYYGGLSGLVYGSICYIALWGLHESQPLRSISLVIIIIIPTKIILEIYLNGFILPYSKQQIFTPIPLSHIVGCLVALFMFFAIRHNSKTGFSQKS
jgi:GlpG protein